MPVPLPTAHDPEVPLRSWLNLPALQVAVIAAVRQRDKEARAAAEEAGRPLADGQGFTLSDLSRECRVSLPTLSGFIRHGERPGARTLGLLLGWLRMDPSPFMVAGPEPGPVDVTAELLAS
jgi:hypothetical protein